MLNRKFGLACVLLLVLSYSPWAEKINAAENSSSVETILKNIPATDNSSIWQAGEKLAALGEDSRSNLEAVLQKENPTMTVAAGYGLMKIGEGIRHPATKALVHLITSPNAPLLRKRQAAQVLGAHGGDYANSAIRELLGRKDLDELLRVDLAFALWKLSHGGTAFEEMYDVATKGKNPVARANAVLALGRAGRIQDVVVPLQALATRPDGKGDEARTLLQLNRKINREIHRDDYPSRLINEVISKVRRYYAPDTTDKNEQEQLDPKNLAKVAASAILNSIDPFSDYLDEESYRDLADQMRAGYGGIGAYVGMREDRRGKKHFTILNPMYGQPAYKAGLRAGDVVESIGGHDITNEKMKDIIKRLKGEPKTTVTLTIKRRREKKTKEYSVMRDEISLPPVIAQMLPGKVGYIKLSGFNSKSAPTMRKALEKFEAQDVRGVILDLSNNPGGLLSAAVGVAELFLGRGKRIVSSKGRPEVYPERIYRSLHKALYTGPLVVMINQGSASASEIVSGAIRDNKRGELVGQKSYGKGSVQQLIPVQTTRGRSRIKLTIAKYYLPNGECIHGRGIKPDVKVPLENLELPEWEARLAIREGRQIFDWLKNELKGHRDQLLALLEFDNLDSSKYPGFADLLSKLDKEYGEKYARKNDHGKLDPEWIRREVRFSIREYLKFQEGINLPADVEDNTSLQHALKELGKHMDGGLPAEPVYDWFRAKFAAEETKVAAANKALAEDEKDIVTK